MKHIKHLLSTIVNLHYQLRIKKYSRIYPDWATISPNDTSVLYVGSHEGWKTSLLPSHSIANELIDKTHG